MVAPISFKKIITIDCREMEHPEPLMKVLEAVNIMQMDEAVLMVHRRVPYPLFARLEEQGGIKFKLTSTPLEKGELVEVLIWRM